MFGEYCEGICRSRVTCQTLAGKIDKIGNSYANLFVTMHGKCCVDFQHSANHERTWSVHPQIVLNIGVSRRSYRSTHSGTNFNVVALAFGMLVALFSRRPK